jgi:hypothetical protein
MKLLGIIAILLAGCAVHQSSAINPRSVDENRFLMSAPTPSDWEIGSVWNFVQYGRDEVAVLDVSFRVTDEPARTCSSGTWRRLEIVEGQVGNGSVELRQAYSVTGRLLTLDLTGGCDFGSIQGVLSERTFEGETRGGLTMGAKFVPQRVVGRRFR